MKAVVLSRYGSHEDLLLAELPKPVPGDHEVLVQVRATTVNDLDWCFIRGKPYIYRLMFGLLKPKLGVLGAEVAGVVEATGRQVTKFRPRDRVYGDLSEAGLGAFAEYVNVKDTALSGMSEKMTFEDAAALPHAGMLARQGLIDVGQIRSGDKVLINGAGGGVGTLGVQIAKQYGAEVTGVDRGFKLSALRSIGFDRVIDYEQEDFTRNGQQFDLILDTKTTRSPLSYLRALKPGGRYVTVGGHLPRLLQLLILGPLIARVTGKQLRIVALRPNKDLAHLNALYETAGLRCVIDGPYPLHEVPKAVRRFGTAQHVGKVVIAVAT